MNRIFQWIRAVVSAFSRGALVVAGSTVLQSASAADDQSINEPVGPVYELEDFVVVAERFESVGEFSMVSVQFLDEDELKRQVQGTLGETLAWEPGLSSSSFGAGASRPVIRGLGDYRVRMLIDDIGTLDVSDTSPDHGVPLEPLLISRVDIHRGPDALVYGNAAIGGAINSQTRYLPEELPPEPLSGSIETRYDTVSDGNSFAAYGTARAGDFALQLTGSRRSAGDYAIPGNARSKYYEAEFTPRTKDRDTGVSVDIPNPSGRLPNSQVDTQTNSVGALWEPESGRGRLGFSYSRYESVYGIPYQWSGSGGEADPFGDTTLDMQQTRFDFDAAVDVDLEILERISFRYGNAVYGHEEAFSGRDSYAGDEYIETTMDLDSAEGRIDVYHRPFEAMEGVIGVHGFERQLETSRLVFTSSTSPDVRAVDVENRGLFLVETLVIDQWTLRGGFRYETQHAEDRSLEEAGIFGLNREVEHESQSVAFGATWRDYERWIFDEIAFTVNVSMVERIPSETELYAFWENTAIQRFVIGDESLETERSEAIELGVEFHRGDWSARFNVYQYDIDGFIFLQDQPGVGKSAKYTSKDSQFRGGEAEITWRVYDTDTETFRIKGMFDLVRGRNQTDDAHLPRIPPARIGTRFEYERKNMQLGADLRYAFSQERIEPADNFSAQEFETDDYFELNFDAKYTWLLDHSDVTVFARIENALDVERRSHASFLKDVAPLPGRNLSIGARIEF